MKKNLTMLLVLCLICVTTAYVVANQSSASSVSTGSDNAALSPEDDSAAGQETSAQALSADTRSADVDLTALSSTMIFAEVYNMMLRPDDYVGRTVKMSGSYYAGYYDKTEHYYHYVVIADASACCQQGMEFVLNGEHSYPDDYPADNTRIEVVGVFDSYEDLGATRYYVVVDDIVVL